MASAFAFVVVMCLAAVQASPHSSRIVGGDVTTIDQYPAIVQSEWRGFFENTWTQFCAANIINTRHVLSAAHCYGGIPFLVVRTRRIRAGATYRNTGGIIIGVERVFNHPSYGQNEHDGDITVVRLASLLIYSDTIQQVGISPPGFDMPDNLPVVHAGWGTVGHTGPMSEQLRHVQIYTVNREVCRQRYLESGRIDSNVSVNMICAGLLDVGGKDACGGDSGGPMYYGENPRMLVGIISWGEDCGDAVLPGVSVAISSYTDWIIETVVPSS